MDQTTVKSYRPLAWPTKGASAETGKWRTLRPVKDETKCIGCLLCWVYCPEAVIDKQTISIDYQYCKGCGICAHECPVKAITMVKEEEA
mgnify:CR=1 FL=1